MKNISPTCFAALHAVGTAGMAKAPSERASFGSARPAADIQACVSAKLADLWAPTVSTSGTSDTLSYGTGDDALIVDIAAEDDVNLVTVDAVHKLDARRKQDIRSCLY